MILKPNEKKMAMTFDDRYDACIERLRNTGKPDFPQDQISHYSDFIELMTLFSGEDGISVGDIMDLFFGEPDEETDAQRKDNEEAFINSIFYSIDERIYLYADAYPFERKSDSLYLKQNISENEKYYVILLISSQLDIFRSFQSDLTTDFETLSFETLKTFLPTAIVKQFGKNTEYTGSAKDKIISLSVDIGIPYDNYAISQIGERNNQERGLDVIGWLPFEDKCQNKVVFLGQCACGKNFEFKQHDTRRFEEYLIFYKTKPQHTLFIPYSLINISAGKFYHNYIENDYLVFERKRMVSLLKDNKIYHKLRSRNLIEKCVAHSSESRDFIEAS